MRRCESAVGEHRRHELGVAATAFAKPETDINGLVRRSRRRRGLLAQRFDDSEEMQCVDTHRSARSSVTDRKRFIGLRAALP